MCGICGFTGSGGRDEGRATLKAMCDAIAHRGPDGQGMFFADGVAFGHRRLSLIDLQGGAQPMTYVIDGLTWAIVFNGEIYNYHELRAELESQGYAFSTGSDTEVLLVGYIAWSQGVLARVRGMFAFAILDPRSHGLFCARDFFGIKPFYYACAGSSFVFASEVKAILEHPAVPCEVNEGAIAPYLCFQFNPLGETLFKGVFKLPAGHFLQVDASGAIEVVRYWHPSYVQDGHRSLDDAVGEIDRVVRESVRYHNVADVEVGSFLSSGIDSSYLAACLARENPSVKTFTVGFSEYCGERDEVSWARELADMLGVENDYAHIGEDEYWDALASVQWHMDEPSADPSAVALYFVDRLAARRVKAVLSGEGADELFGGYRVYQAPLASSRLSHVPKPVLRAGARTLHALGRRGEHYLERASMPVDAWYYTNANGVAFAPDDLQRVLAPALREAARAMPLPQELVAGAYAEAGGLDEVTRMQSIDMRFWLTGDILLKTDKMAMAHSLESRVPFLDREVFACASSLPTSQKVSASQTKIALRQAARRAIPRAWAQKEKLGFPVPIAAWLRGDRRYEQVRREFMSGHAARFFDVSEIVRLLDAHRAGAADNARRIWIVYSFLLWYRVFFVERARPAPRSA